MRMKIKALQSCLLVIVSLFFISVTLAAVPDKAQTQIDLNTATEKELTSLPGIGTATAKNIVAARPFKNVEDLEKVKGIGKTKFESLKDKVTVGEAAGGAPVSKVPVTAVESEKKGRTAPQPSVGETGKAALPMGPININTADQKTLEALPGIGPVKAKAIIDHRPYTKVEDIMKVPGIKEGTFAKIKDQIVVK